MKYFEQKKPPIRKTGGAYKNENQTLSREPAMPVLN